MLRLRVQLDVRGTEHLDRPSKRCLYICNHQSFADILVLVPVLKSVAFLAREDVRTMPVVGAFAHAGGSVFVKRSCVADRKRALQDTIRMCKESTGVVVFPEGKMSQDGRLLEKVYYSTLYRAFEEGLPVIPIGLHGTRNVMPISLDRIRTGERVAIRIGEVCSPADAGSAEEFARECWGRVKELHCEAHQAVAARDPASGVVRLVPSTVRI